MNASLAGACLILPVLLLSLLGKGLPAIFRCLLFALVAVRLLLPFSLSAPFGFLPANGFLPLTLAAQPDRRLSILSGIYLTGVFLMLSYLLFSTLRVRRLVRFAVPVFYEFENRRVKLYRCDDIQTAFVFGLVYPKIYVPYNVTGADLTLVVEHELIHLKRHDHLLKLCFYLLLALHWFNPLVWVSYLLLGKSMEDACDESVIGDFSAPERDSYANALLSVSTGKRELFAIPVAFGEIPVKSRVSRVIEYRRPKRIVYVLSAVLLGLLGTFFFTGRPVQAEEEVYPEPVYEPFYSEHYRIESDDEEYGYRLYDDTGTFLGLFQYGDPIVVSDEGGSEWLFSYYEEYSAFYQIPVDEELHALLVQSVGGEKYWRTEDFSDWEIQTDEKTGLSYLYRTRDMIWDGRVLLRNESDTESFNALADAYVEAFPQIIPERGVGWIYADLEVKGLAARNADGFIFFQNNGIRYLNLADWDAGWNIDLTFDECLQMDRYLREHRGAVTDLFDRTAWESALATAGITDLDGPKEPFTPGMNATGKDPSAWHIIVEIPEDVRQGIFDLEREGFLEGYGLGKADGRSEFYHAFQLTLPEEERLAATWTLGRYELMYATAFVAAVREALPYWDYGDPFDPEIVADITRESVEERIVSDGTEFTLSDE